jgi:toxin ParE1/3/4
MLDIWSTVAIRSEVAADVLTDRFYAAFELLSHTPFFGALRDDVRKELRHVVVSPYIILYRATRTKVTIVRIVHERRDLPSLFRRR